MVERLEVFEFQKKQEERLDHFLVESLPEFSRSRLQALVKDGFVTIDGIPAKKSGQKLEQGSQVEVRVPSPVPSGLVGENIPLDIVFENNDLLVVNKPAGMVVHPAVGHSSGTLVHAVLGYDPEIEGIGGEERPGVVHRLDKETSGLILLAKNERAHRWLGDQFRLRKVEKMYLALVDGAPPTPSGRVEASIGRDPSHRKKMAIMPPGKGREAVSEYKTLESFEKQTLLEFHPHTGRTHQIRLHCMFLGCPIVGDKIYGHRKQSVELDRHFLHAARLKIVLPGEKEAQTFEAPLPDELQELLDFFANGGNMEYIDLRSDTVTKPTPEMREAMAKAEVGDDVYGDDPTVNRLQEMAAEITGHEAALFVASGTMGNLSAVLAHCQRGDEVILGKEAHTYRYEAGGISVLGGVHSCQLPNQPDGTIALDDMAGAIRSDDPHQPITRLVTIENTQNRCGGKCLSVEYTNQVAEFAHERGLKVHLDGARVFNAAASLGVPVKELTSTVDSVTFCLSKGLSAPVGSVLCGSKEFIEKAHRVRKMLGGGMRQAGVLAAAGIVALEKVVPRLGEDHVRARTLAEGLRENRGLVLDAGTPATNMIFMNLSDEVEMSADEVAEKMKEHGVLAGVAGKRRFRLVTHYWIDDAAVERTVTAFAAVLN